MEPVRIIQGTMLPLMRSHIDTDQIIPKQFLKRVERTGFGPFLFYDWAFDHEGELRPDFILNQAEYGNATVLVAGHNFGSGSSREHAPWALLDRGFQAIIAPSFADIFRNNSHKNGLLPIILGEEHVERSGRPRHRPHRRGTHRRVGRNRHGRWTRCSPFPSTRS